MNQFTQRDFEEYTAQLGTDKILDAAEDTTKDFESNHLKKIVKEMIEPFGCFIDEKAKLEEKNYTKGPKPLILKLLKSDALVNSRKQDKTITPLQLSFITTKIVISSIRCNDENTKETYTASKIGKEINLNLAHEFRLSDGDAIKYGAYMVKYFAEAFPQYVSVDLSYEDRKSKWQEKQLVPTQLYLDTVANNIETLAELSIVTFPMVEKPMDWTTDGSDGGYYTEIYKRNIIKKRQVGDGAGINQEIAGAVNVIQGTPWELNLDTIDIIDKLNKTKPESLKKVFPLVVNKTPEKPYPDVLYSDMDEDQLKIHRQWSSLEKKLKKDRQAKISVDLAREGALRQAKFFIHDTKFHKGKIWFPHDLDYRIRTYNKSMTGLNTQGADFQKGMIKFANKHAVTTDNGIKWLKINMSNLIGFDKLTLPERVQKCNEHEGLIREVVKNPYKCTEWHKWDKPVQGLAAAIEYVKWLDNDQALLQTHIQLDGLCNGVQNLAALTRDHLVAPHVGLIWTPERGDVYGYVNNDVIERITPLGCRMSDEWLRSELMTRSLTKTPVMTRSYGATIYGIKDGCKEFIEDQGKSAHFEDLFKSGNWMGERIWESMEGSLAGPMSFMEWAQKCAGIMAKANLPLPWTNPALAQCMQSPFETKRKEIKVKINGQAQSYYIMKHTNKIARAKAESSSSPNMIHSCDGSHLIGTTNHCVAKGIRDFAMVHDSFGTIPDHAEGLLDSTKDAWVEQYSEDWILRWYHEWVEFAISKGKPEVAAALPHPYKEDEDGKFVIVGTLNIEDVRKSDFFFA